MQEFIHSFSIQTNIWEVPNEELSVKNCTIVNFLAKELLMWLLGTTRPKELTSEQFHIYIKQGLEDHPSEVLHDLMERRFHWYDTNEKRTVKLSMCCAYMPCQQVPRVAWIQTLNKIWVKKTETIWHLKEHSEKDKPSFPIWMRGCHKINRRFYNGSRFQFPCLSMIWPFIKFKTSCINKIKKRT